jgi:hypothetical protein
MNDNCDGGRFNGPSLTMLSDYKMPLTPANWKSGAVFPLAVRHTYNNTILTTNCQISCSVFTATTTKNIVVTTRLESEALGYFQDLIDHKRRGNDTFEVSSVFKGFFSLTTEGGENVTVVGDTSYRSRAGPYFFESTKVTVGNVECNISSITSGVMLIQMPRIEMVICAPVVCVHHGPQLFPDANGSREVEGYFPITVKNPSRYSGSPPAPLSCPPACPGSTVDTIVGGVFYMYLCDQYITGPPCLTLEHASSCAYGSGRYCDPCPTGAFCPGGFRLW